MNLEDFSKHWNKFGALAALICIVGVGLAFVTPSGRVHYLPGNNDSQFDSPEIVEQTETPGSPLKVIVGGDVMLARTIEPKMLYQSFDPGKNLRPIFKAADLVVVNLEYVAANTGTAIAKSYTFRAGAHTLDYLRELGVDVVSLANNHAGDYWYDGFLQMLENLKQARLGYFGGGKNAARAYAPLYVTLDETTFAFIGVNMVETPYFAATDFSPGNAWLDESKLKASIKKADQIADVVIVMPHWGIEYTDEVEQSQKKIGKLSIDWGADLVIGGHTHHVQRSEKYRSGEIFYSMGNLIFDGPGPAGWNSGYLVEVIFDPASKQTSTRKINYHVSDTGFVSLN